LLPSSHEVAQVRGCAGMEMESLKTSVWIITALLVGSQLFITGAGSTASNGVAALNDAASAGFNLPGCRDFLAAGTNSPQRWAAWMCAGKVLTLDADSVFLSPPLHACTLKAVPATGLVRAVVDHFDAHPSRLSEPFSALALEALAQAWPCPDHPTQ
jgi:hypothetical protein